MKLKRVRPRARDPKRPYEWKRAQYLRFVEKLGHKRACAIAQLTPLQWHRQMAHEPDFRRAVERLTGMTLKTTDSPTELYMKALAANWGNDVKARKAAGLTKDDVVEMRLQKRFRDLEAQVMEGIVAEIQEQNVRAMVGADPKVRDTGHLRWGLEHIDPDRWGPRAKVVEIRHHSEKELDADIERLQALEPPEEVQT